MQKIQITEAKKIAERIGAEAVVIIAFNGDRLAMTSYGATKAKCAATGRWVDMVADDLASGRMAAPDLRDCRR
jgi:uncharacterized protein YbjQ (UPF0145 family)